VGGGYIMGVNNRRLKVKKETCLVCKQSCATIDDCAEWKAMRDAIKKDSTTSSHVWNTLDEARDLGKLLAKKIGSQKRLGQLIKVSQTFVSCFLRDR
jgi:hypothetical protein